MKLRTKFSLIFSVLVLFVTIGLSSSFLVLEKQHLLSQMEKNKLDTLNGLVKVGEESFITGNSISVLNYMKERKNVRGLAYAVLTDVKGKILAHTDAERIGQDDTARPGLSGNISEISASVSTGGAEQGFAKIGFSDAVFQEMAKASLAETKERLLPVSLLFLVLGILAASLLAVLMTKPIKRMAWASNQIGQGKLDTKIEVQSADELGDLARDLNIMAVKLKELDEMKQDFVSSITHEFRSPLHAMSIHFDLLFAGHQGGLTDKQKESLTVLKNNARRLERFINDLLDAARMEKGKMEVKPEEFDLRPAVDDVFKLLKVNADKKGIELRCELPQDLPRAFADPGRTSQVLTNLVTNAIKFTAGGRVSITAKALDKDIEIAVSDTGQGIPKDQIHKLFNKFEQIKGVKAQGEGPKGTGLGLSIVKGIVESQGGKVWIESEPGKGSIFYFTLIKM